MSLLLSLPRELRDEIISQVLITQIPLPANGTRLRTSDFLTGQHVFLPSYPAAYRPPSLSFLVANKQLYAETLSCLARSEVVLTLDVTILDMLWLWPTYRTILPRSGTALDRMDVNIFLAVSEESSQMDLIHHIPEAFWRVIWRFLTLGPVGEVVNHEMDRNIYVRELRVNLDSEKHQTGNYMFSEDEIPLRTVEGFAHLTANHRWLFGAEADIAVSFIDQFCTRTDFDISYSRIHQTWYTRVFENIGRILVCVDGQVREEFNPGNYDHKSHHH